MTNSVAQKPVVGLSLGFTSETAPNSTGIPFIHRFPLPLEGLITEFLDCNQVIDLAASKDSPLKSNPAIQRTAAVWHAEHPAESNAVVEELEKRERQTEEAALRQLKTGRLESGGWYVVRQLKRLKSGDWCVVSQIFGTLFLIALLLAPTFLGLSLITALLVFPPLLLALICGAIFCYLHEG